MWESSLSGSAAAGFCLDQWAKKGGNEAVAQKTPNQHTKHTRQTVGKSSLQKSQAMMGNWRGHNHPNHL